jgi:transglutaminase-like putative cysteine protease
VIASLRALLAPSPTVRARVGVGATMLRRAHLQRLVWVIAALALSIAPHLSHLAPWVVVLAVASGAWRVVVEVKGLPLPPRWARILVAFCALLGVLATYRTLNGVEAGTALLVVMAGMKLLETRSVRDLTVIVFLAYFALFAAFLYEQQLLYLPYMLATAWLLTVTLMRIHESTATLRVREAARLTGKMLLQALPLAVLLFVFFPRLPGQFWAVPARSQAVMGVSDEMSPGDISELTISDEPAFRVRFSGDAPPARERYWRGPVLHEFDGRTWRRGMALFLPQVVSPSGPSYGYRLTLEPHQQRWVFALDAVTGWPGQRTSRTADLQLVTARSFPVSTLTSFDLTSNPAYRIEAPLPVAMRNADLALPVGRNPRSVALARELRAQARDDRAFIQAVLAKFRNEEYFYTLEPPRLERESVDDFLFNTRRGFCEHFASAFTVLARAANIPARVVTGYQGGQFNPLGGYYIVRQSDAHAWAEVWLEGAGWVRVDPTAAVAPERIETGSLARALARDAAGAERFSRDSEFISSLRFAWDAANTFWNDQVVEFGEAQQRWLLKRFDVADLRWEYLGFALFAALVGFFAAMSAYLAWRFRPRRRDPVVETWRALRNKLGAKQLVHQPHEGPVDYLVRAARARPELAAQLGEIRELYVSLRYGPAPLASQLSRLKFLVNQLRV